MYQDQHWPKFNDIDDYWQSKQLSDLRDNLQKGIEDSGCQSCWNMEKFGQISLRQSVTPDRLSAVDFASPRLTQVKLITGKTCNLACMMCFPTVSSTHHQLWNDDSSWRIPINRTQDLEYDHDMDQFIREHAGELKYIEVLGGEPLFSKLFLDLVKHLVDINASQHITLFVITNGSLMTSSMINLFKKFKKTVFTVSVDGIGLVNDYQRWPSQWSQIENNLKMIKDNFDLSILPTVTAINIARLSELYNYCEQQGIVINNFSLVNGWPQLLPVNLPQSIKDRIDSKFCSIADGIGDTRSLLEFIRKWDHKRGISIADYLPEWQGLI